MEDGGSETAQDGVPELSVVIAARNAAGVVGDQIRALLAQDAPGTWEVVIADNGSSDGTADVAMAAAAGDYRLRVADASASRGIGPARNAGAAAAEGRLLAFCDADDVVGERWVSSMMTALREHEYVTGPLEIDSLNDPRAVAARGRWLASRRVPDFHGVIEFANGCNIGVHRTTLERAGGFQSMDMGGDDIDLAIRLHQLGVHVEFEQGALVHYRFRNGLRAIWGQGIAYGKAQPSLAARARAAGLPVPRAKIRARSWVWLATHIGLLLHSQWRGRWLWAAATKAGLVVGSIRVHRIDI